VTTFLVEAYVPASAAKLLSLTEMRRAARALACGGEVRHLRSIFVPRDETCFHLLEGPSAQAVGEAAQKAAIPFERVVEAIQVCAEDAAYRKEQA
jgi:hypothetical protein